MSADNVHAGLRDCPKHEYLAEKRRFQGKYEILRTISQPGADIISRHTRKPERGHLFYNPSINFHIAIKLRVNTVKKPVVIWWQMRVIDASKQKKKKTSLVFFHVNRRTEKLKLLC